MIDHISPRPPITASRAVLVGHCVVLPVLLITAGVGMLAHARGGATAAGILIGAAAGWLWWALAVPRWRLWAVARGAEPGALQQLAQRSRLVWPAGSVLAKTELPPRPR